MKGIGREGERRERERGRASMVGSRVLKDRWEGGEKGKGEEDR